MSPERAKELVEKGKKSSPIIYLISTVLAFYTVLFLTFKLIPALIA